MNKFKQGINNWNSYENYDLKIKMNDRTKYSKY